MLTVLLYVPNLIGYLRLALLVAAFHGGQLFGLGPGETVPSARPLHFLGLYAASALLDGLDGIAARRLDQCSAFGAWLDVIIDNIGRTLLWTTVAPGWGGWVACFEWTTFSCTHCIGAGWKVDFGAAPRLVTGIMANGFYNPLGVWAIAGLHFLPFSLYIQGLAQHPDLAAVTAAFAAADRKLGGDSGGSEAGGGGGTGLRAVIAVLALGRALTAVAETWFVWGHICWMCLPVPPTKNLKET
eukprot:SAG22_NODE_344_length_11914_cov_6.665679_2_plen_242_part_00